MTWQKTFTLSKRSKGCHLVTEEILTQIEAGLSDVQVRSNCPTLEAKKKQLITVYLIGRHVVLVHVGFRVFSSKVQYSASVVLRPNRQHTSAALTINENYDRGAHSAWRYLVSHLCCY